MNIQEAIEQGILIRKPLSSGKGSRLGAHPLHEVESFKELQHWVKALEADASLEFPMKLTPGEYEALRANGYKAPHQAQAADVQRWLHNIGAQLGVRKLTQRTSQSHISARKQSPVVVGCSVSRRFFKASTSTA